MRRYETIYIIRPGVTEDDITAITDKATATITSHDGSVVTNDKWGLRKLAYPIKKEQMGNYVYLEYAGVPEAVAEIERVFRIDDRVIKYMTIKTQDVYTQDVEAEKKTELQPEQDQPDAEEKSEAQDEQDQPEVEEEAAAEADD